MYDISKVWRCHFWRVRCQGYAPNEFVLDYSLNNSKKKTPDIGQVGVWPFRISIKFLNPRTSIEVAQYHSTIDFVLTQKSILRSLAGNQKVGRPFISFHFDVFHVTAVHTAKRFTLWSSALWCRVGGYKFFENTKCFHLRDRASENNSGNNMHLPAHPGCKVFPQSVILSAKTNKTNVFKSM
jgi:hypothetical protein